jgi:F-type H+-transporting ATPase subunit delta
MLATEEGQREEYGAALNSIKESFVNCPEYVELLSSPNISLNERLSALNNVFAEAVPEYVLSFLQLMCEKGRIAYLDTAIAEYKSLLDASKHVLNVKVTSAVELTAEEKNKLKQKLKTVYKGEVNIEYFIDTQLIGGLIVEADGKIMDGSLRQRLREVKEVISI